MIQFAEAAGAKHTAVPRGAALQVGDGQLDVVDPVM